MRLSIAAAAAWLAWVGGCTSGSTSGSTDSGVDVAEEAPDLCDIDQFFDAGGVGGSCLRVAPTRCFPMCATGGCRCAGGPSGPTWTCTIDTSCLPDCGPLDGACATQEDGSPLG